MLIKKELLCSNHGSEQGYLINIKDDKKLECQQCGCLSFTFEELPTCVSCDESLGLRLVEDDSVCSLVSIQEGGE